MPIPLKQNKKPETQKTTKKEPENKGKSFASMYKDAEATGGRLPVGIYEGIITDSGSKEKDGKTSVYFELTAVNCDDDSLNGKKAWLNYQMLVTNPESWEQEGAAGMGFHKSDMAKLGFEGEFESLEDVLTSMNDIVEQKLLVRFSVKESKGYTNTYLDKLFDDQDSKPEVPWA